MKFTTLVSAALALASGIIAGPVGLAARQYLALTSGDYAASVGIPMAITWSGASGAVTLNLKSGSADNLETIGTIAGKHPHLILSPYDLLAALEWYG